MLPGPGGLGAYRMLGFWFYRVYSEPYETYMFGFLGGNDFIVISALAM